jgi:HK97 gp10 family phage protein
MGAELKITGLDGVLEMLLKMPPEIVSKRGGPVKTALRKGASVIAKQARANLRAVTNNQTASGEKESTGLLAKSIVVTRGKAPTTGNGERYLVRVKGKTYARKGKVVTTKKTAQLLEYGSSKQPAEPWLRPAFASKATEAINTVVRELPKEIDKAAQKYLNKRK